MHYVYLIKSGSHPNQKYIGITSNLRERLNAHNEGRSSHTAKYKPWKLVTYIAFSDETRAVEFERYLKSGSGHAFASKRLW
jgi:predicted GIY-YIG superfamily endonuclease